MSKGLVNSRAFASAPIGTATDSFARVRTYRSATLCLDTFPFFTTFTCGLKLCWFARRYESSQWGWSDKQKREEMTEEAAWYLIAYDAEQKPVAVCHFRFDIDNDDEVLYW